MAATENYWATFGLKTVHFFAATTDFDFKHMANVLPAYFEDNYVLIQAPEPLSNKHNALMQQALKYEWSYIVTWDSDNRITKEGATAYAVRFTTRRIDFQGVRDIYFVNDQTGEAMAFSYDRFKAPNIHMGTGRTLSRALCNACNPIWPKGLKNGLDINSELRIMAMGFQPHIIKGRAPLWVDIKGPESVNSYNKWRLGGYTCDKSEVLNLCL
jgi:hypothetical protein